MSTHYILIRFELPDVDESERDSLLKNVEEMIEDHIVTNHMTYKDEKWNLELIE